MTPRETWTEQRVEPAGFGKERVWRLREYPEFGVVLSMAGEGLSVWDTSSRRRVHTFTPGTDKLSGDMHRASALAPDGALVYLRRGQVWRLPLGAFEARVLVDGLPEQYNHLTLSPDNDTVACFDHDRELGFVVASLSGGEVLWERRAALDGLNFSPTGLHLMASNDQTWQSGSDTVDFTVHAALTGDRVSQRGSTCWMESLFWSDDGRDVVLQDWSSGRKPKRVWRIHDGPEGPLHLLWQEANWSGVRQRNGLG